MNTAQGINKDLQISLKDYECFKKCFQIEISA
jgi:hypothetical protein